jgi:hypothetical protein
MFDQISHDLMRLLNEWSVPVNIVQIVDMHRPYPNCATSVGNDSRNQIPVILCSLRGQNNHLDCSSRFEPEHNSTELRICAPFLANTYALRLHAFGRLRHFQASGNRCNQIPRRPISIGSGSDVRASHVSNSEGRHSRWFTLPSPMKCQRGDMESDGQYPNENRLN